MDIPLTSGASSIAAPTDVQLGVADGTAYENGVSGSGGWGAYETGGDWVPPGTRVIIHYTPTTNVGFWDYRFKVDQVTPGATYFASVYLGCHRMHSRVAIEWLDAAGSTISFSDPADANARNNAEAFGGNSISAYKRVYMSAVAPSTARRANVYVPRFPTLVGETNSYLFMTRPMFEEARTGQTIPGPWAPGTYDANRLTLVTANAAITTNAAAIATETSARASADTTLTASVGTLTSSVATNASAITAVDGKLSASYALTVDGNGRIASMKLLSNGTTSSVKFTADTFQVFNGSTDVAPFEVTGGNVKIKSANVGTLNVGSGGLTIQSGSSGARIVISNSVVEVYDATRLRVRMGLW